mgnify:CR=1 FL=1
MLGDFLVEQKLISPSQLDEVLSQLPRSGRRIGQLLVEKGYIEEDKLKEALQVLLNKKDVDIYEGDSVLLDKNGLKITKTRIINMGKTYPITPTSSARMTYANYKRRHQSEESGKGSVMVAIGMLIAIAGIFVSGGVISGNENKVNPIFLNFAYPGLAIITWGIILYSKKVETTYRRYYLQLFEHGINGVKVFKDSKGDFIEEAVEIINKNISEFENWEDRKQQFKISQDDLDRARKEMNQLRESRGQKPIEHDE